jgi:sugar (pentulose or hexulose) kinase
MALILAIDCGTQSLRALIYDLQGRLLAKEKVEYEPYSSQQPGWAEQDPEVWWQALCQACQALKAKHPDLVEKLAVAAVTAQRNTIINVDERGIPLRSAILWLDQRKADRTNKLDFLTRLSHRVVGMTEAVAIVQRDAKVNWLRQNQGELWAKSHKVLMVSAFLNHRLTGLFTDSVASQIGHIPFDYKGRRWAKARDFKSVVFPVEKEKLVDLVEPGQVIGPLIPEAAKATGLPMGLPVAAAGSDKGCETLGVGCLDPSAASLSFGTTATVQTASRRYLEPIRFMPAYPAPVPGEYNLEVQVPRGYWMISWFKREFGSREQRLAEQEGIPPEEVLNRLLSQVPAGAMGLILQPFWGAGLKTPEAKGAMIGFGDVHNRAHMYRAIVEGLGFALLDGLNRIEAVTGQRVKGIHVSGGGSQSDDICRITAHIFNRPVFRGETTEAASLGAAISGAVALGAYPGYREAAGAMVRHQDRFDPDPEIAEVYHQLYTRVYLGLYKILKPVYQEIREILNYPEKVY